MNALARPGSAWSARRLLNALALLAVTACTVFVLRMASDSVQHALTAFDLTADGGDQGQFAELARVVARGGVLYRDLAHNNKPPGMFLLMSPFVAAFGNTAFAVGLSLVFMQALFVASVGFLAWQVTRSGAATAGAALLALYYAAAQTLLETTLPMAAFSALAVGTAVAARGRAPLLVAAGLLFVAGLFMKQPILAEAPALLGFGLWAAPRSRRAVLTTVLALGAGMALGTGLLAAWALHYGILDDLWFSVFVSAGRYAAGEGGAWHFSDATLGLFERYFPYTLRYLSVLLILGLAAAILALRARSGRAALWLTLGWLVLELAGASIARAFLPAYYTQALPALILLVALGVPAARALGPAWRVLLAAALLAVLVAGFADTRRVVASGGPGMAVAAPVVALIEERTQPGDCLWLWGVLHHLSFVTERPSCAARSYDAQMMDESAFPIVPNRISFLGELLRRTPALYVERSAWGLFPELERYAERYRRALLLESGGYRVYAVDRSAWRPVRVDFGGEVALIGYDLPPREAWCAGDALPMTLTWERLSQPRHQYQAFVHLLTQDETARVAGYDGPPARRPTYSWVDEGQLVLGDPFALDVPSNTTPGTYRLVAGLYEVETLEPLPITGAGEPRRYAVLTTVQIEDCE